MKLPPLGMSIFKYAWLGLAGITTPLDQRAFRPWVSEVLNMEDERIKITNGVFTLLGWGLLIELTCRCQSPRCARSSAARYQACRCGGLRDRNGGQDHRGLAHG
jgi:hypothetical protein